MVCKIARLAATASQKKNHNRYKHTLSKEQLSNHISNVSNWIGFVKLLVQQQLLLTKKSSSRWSTTVFSAITTTTPSPQSRPNPCLSLGSYRLHCQTHAFLLVLIACSVKPMPFYLILPPALWNLSRSISSYRLHCKTHAFLLVPIACWFPYVPKDGITKTMVYLACLSGPLMWLIKVVNKSVHCHDHDHNHNHYHIHDQHKLSNEQLSNHVFFTWATE